MTHNSHRILQNMPTGATLELYTHQSVKLNRTNDSAPPRTPNLDQTITDCAIHLSTRQVHQTRSLHSLIENPLAGVGQFPESEPGRARSCQRSHAIPSLLVPYRSYFEMPKGKVLLQQSKNKQCSNRDPVLPKIHPASNAEPYHCTRIEMLTSNTNVVEQHWNTE
jgi:hypothetical protein